MTTPFWCLFVAAVLPFALAGVGAYLRIQQLGSLDSHHPRVQALELRGNAARAYASQQNAWEALALFGAAVFTAHLTGADAGQSATAAIVFVIARVLHPAMYIADLSTLRTAAFTVGFGCCLWLFGLAARA